MRVVLFGLGEVGRCFASALAQGGAEMVLCEPRPSAASRDLAARLGQPLHSAPGPWCARAGWLLSCVTGAQAGALVDQALPFLAPGQVFVDMTTASPDVKCAAAAHVAAQGGRYLDCAIMGSIAMMGLRTPLLLAGADAPAFAALISQSGGRASVVDGGVPGDAIALKILRSVFTKGLEALAVELLMSAEQKGVRHKLYGQLADIDETPLPTLLEGLVRTHVVHARRRAHEVRDAQAELISQGLPSLVLPGVERRFEQTALKREQAGGPEEVPDIEAALAWLMRR